MRSAAKPNDERDAMQFFFMLTLIGAGFGTLLCVALNKKDERRAAAAPSPAPPRVEKVDPPSATDDENPDPDESGQTT